MRFGNGWKRSRSESEPKEPERRLRTFVSMQGMRLCQPQTHDLSQQTRKENDPPRSRFNQSIGRLGLYQTLRPIVVGIVHGLAGSAGIALLILARSGMSCGLCAYVVVFGIGAVAGMALIATAIAIPTTYGTRRFAGSTGIWSYSPASSALVVLDCSVAYHVSVINGLFTAHPLLIRIK